jgi:hypothetical protein
MNRPSAGRRLARAGASAILAAALLSQAIPGAAAAASVFEEPGTVAQAARTGALSAHSIVRSTGRQAASPRAQGAQAINVRALLGQPAGRPAFDPASVDATVGRLEASHVRQEAASEKAAELTPDSAPPAAPTLAIDSGEPGAPVSVAEAGASELSTDAETPDSSVAAGPDEVVQVANFSVTFSSRSGTFLGSTALIDFFNLHPNGAPNTTFEYAPRVQFDTARQRWIATEVAWDCGTDVFINDTAKFGHGYLDYAISDSADPLGTWTNSYYWWNDFVPDQPSSGFSSDKLVLASNLYAMGPGGTPSSPGCASGSFQEENFIAMDWAQLGPHYSLDSLIFFGGGDSTLDAMKVARGDTELSPDIRLLGSANGSYPGDTAGDAILIGIRGSVVRNTLSFFAFNVTVDGILAGFQVPPDPHQPGGSGILSNVIDGGPDSVSYSDGGLFFSSTYPCQPTGDSVTRDCLRVTTLSEPDVSNEPAVIGDVLLASNGFDVSFGAVARLGDSDLLAVYTQSSATSMPSSYERHALITGPWDHWSAPSLLTAGTASYGGSRWGSYLGLSADPQDADAAWAADPYPTGSGTWATTVHQFDVRVGSGYIPISPLRVLDSRIGLGLIGALSPGVPQTFAVDGVGGIPGNADAITANVTITGQTAAGYISLGPSETANPASSTLNFPYGDTRANNVSLAVSDGGQMSVVYKGVPGSHVYVLLDVTGYFLRGSGESYFPMSPVRILDSRSGLGAATFHSQVAQSFQVQGFMGIPVDATAITGNVTVTGQTKAGYVSITPTLNNNPTTSTINFPVGDTRANGLTIPIGPDGKVGAVYRAISGATANLVLDVTGYYSPASGGLMFYPLNPGRRIDTRLPLGHGGAGNGLTGAQTSEPRSVGIGTHFGVPGSAKAITGNLTVTGQTAAGFVSVTDVSEVNPSTSTINFPRGDTRANGITTPLDSGSLWFVYRAGGGKVVQLILDITGFFQ